MANWYERTIVPHIIRIGCGCAMMAEYRQEIVPQARGRVLEVGLGAGANLPFYDVDAVSAVVGIEPSPELRAMAAKANRPASLDVEIIDAAGESLPFEAETFDTVLCTFTLCSVQDENAMLSEAKRVLRPDGVFLFCEHGSAPDPSIRKWQRRIEPMWKRVLGGCHLTRPIKGSIEKHFAIDGWTGKYQKGPSIAGWMEWGRAVRH